MTVYWLMSGSGLRAWRAFAAFAAFVAAFALAFHLAGFISPPNETVARMQPRRPDTRAGGPGQPGQSSGDQLAPARRRKQRRLFARNGHL